MAKISQRNVPNWTLSSFAIRIDKNLMKFFQHVEFLTLHFGQSHIPGGTAVRGGSRQLM